MSICGRWSLVKKFERTSIAKPLKCQSWQCDTCKPIRRRRLIAQAFAGNPSRFVTLTANPREGANPVERLFALSRAWRLLVKRLRRMHPRKSIEYLCVVERTKLGEPHLHILLKSPYIPQSWLSSVMRELNNAPICDIRSVKGKKDVIAYVTKYVSKDPTKIGTGKRYWFSQRYRPAKAHGETSVVTPEVKFRLIPVPVGIIADEWRELGYLIVEYDDGVNVAIPSHVGQPAPP